ncbi:glycosyltransferase [Variovorax sp. ZT4R33]|uniref:glycosyltransferase n=1 Tax=Variovorax sp. ZT4R33 TaxID=3443743 RepID=UPI003F48DD1F
MTPLIPSPDARASTAGHAHPAHETPFRSFWMGGYEGADHLNSHGMALNLRRSNGHVGRLDEDHAALAPFGIRTIRESIGWRASTDARGRLDLSAALRTARSARRHGLQVIWTLHHYGLPPGVDFFAEDFAHRFADFCGAVARALKRDGESAPVYQPINEISFLSWAAGTTNLVHPYQPGPAARGWELKCRLARAAIAGCDALWSVAPNARIVHTDPVIHVVGEHADERAMRDAAALVEQQYQGWDLLSGRLEPGLGGAPRYLDLLGINYYHSNQWAWPSEERLFWHLSDPRRRPFDALLDDVWQRYRRPLFVAETGHVGIGRTPWFEDIAQAVLRAQARGVPLHGVCLYPLVDRTDWETPSQWHRSGLWDVRGAARAHPDDTAALPRVLHAPLAQRLRQWQAHVPAPDAAAADALVSDPAFPFSIHSTGPAMTTLIVFSHLRWDFVYQRPQQLLSRLAKRFSVVFVEEPVPHAERAALERLQPCVGVEVLRPHLTGSAPGFHDDHIPQLQAMLADHLKARAMNDYWLWFYTPMAMPLAAGLHPGGVIYDCMDELAAFRHAPRQLLQRENALFKMADLVFTGGQSLYESKRDRHPRVHCFPSSVDAAHFSKGVDGDTMHAAQAHIGGPRIGYCGVIDERVDLGLIDALSQAHDDWEIVMVGPVVKIDPASLPQRGNIHWLGQQDYADLPALIAGWDVCLMPFALNEATRFISPTKTLEYMAAGKPVVSTPIRDVVTPYAGIVAIADTPDAFVAACEQALAQTPEQRAQAEAAWAAVVAGTSWDGTAAAMVALIEAQAQGKPRTERETADQTLTPTAPTVLPTSAVA